MVDFVAFPSRWRIMLLLLGSAAFVVAGLWMGGVLGDPPASRRYSALAVSIVGWFSVVFFGLCGAAAIKGLFDTKEQLRIGPAGIRSLPWSGQTIPWSEIVEISSWHYKSQSFVILHLRDPSRFPGRGSRGLLAGANRALTGGDISINLTPTDRSFDEAMEAIERFRP